MAGVSIICVFILLGENMFLKFRETLSIVAICASSAATAEQDWKPIEGSWYLVAIHGVMEEFGMHTFDEFIWVDEHTLWAIRPSYGTKQNLLARTVCRNISASVQPIGHAFTLKFYDTDAYRAGNLSEHASVTCKK